MNYENKKFETGKDNNQGISKRNIWFNYCKRKQIPYIAIKEKTKFSIIEWDYINLIGEKENIINNNEDLVRNEFFKIFEEFCNKKSQYSISNHVVVFNYIEKEKAETMAIRMFDHVKSILDGRKL